MAAWEAYKATDDYANTKRWAGHDDQAADGSLWASFERGWLAAGGPPPFAPVAAPALIRHATSCRAYANYQPPYEDCTCAAPAPDAMPEIQVGDELLSPAGYWSKIYSPREADGWRYDAQRRNGVVIWRRQEAQP